MRVRVQGRARKACTMEEEEEEEEEVLLTVYNK
jgi:hypothetical protein